jgi:hypothetical protein
MSDVQYRITPDGRTEIDNYGLAKPFASFFPGVAGLDGIPLWVFYVNRGQGVCAFGVRDRDAAILEWNPAHVAWRTVALLGFRTFLKVRVGGDVRLYEPFRTSLANRADGCTNVMAFTPAWLSLRETNPALGLSIEVTYITVPQEPFPALARRVRIRNAAADERAVEIIDGLPAVTPYGLLDADAKHMGYTRRSWTVVLNRRRGAPYYQLRGMPASDTETRPYDRGNFALYVDGAGRLPAIVDPAAVFGPNTDLDVPAAFLAADPYAVPDHQAEAGTTPAAMAFAHAVLPAEGACSLVGLFGQARGLEDLDAIAAWADGAAWFDDKQRANERIIHELTNGAATFSAEPTYDYYCRYTFLDNVLRGGLPVALPDPPGPKRTFHVYSRIHGDLERDYNFFQLEPSYWSQGNAGYRDTLQNRRHDVYVNPEVGDENIRAFASLLRLDGYNPHLLLGTVFVPQAAADVEAAIAAATAGPEHADAVKALAFPHFTPGKILTAAAREHIALTVEPQRLLGELIARSSPADLVNPTLGFWTDHWHYLLDAIDSLLSVFPERMGELLTGERAYTVGWGPVHVNPRSRRYVLRDGRCAQANFVEGREDWRAVGPDPDALLARTGHGRGEVYRTTLAAKLLCVLATRMATLDPFGVGIEFEAGRSDWNDSLHGLASIFGSSTNETIELRRLARLLLAGIESTGVEAVAVYRELAELIDALRAALRDDGDDEAALLAFWDRTNTAKEAYRAAVRDGVDGAEVSLGRDDLVDLLRACVAKLDRGIARAVDPDTGLINAYFYHDLVEYDVLERDGRTVIRPRRFTQTPLCPFLEGPMHYLRTVGDREAARRQYRAVRRSDLYDPKLRMYKVCAAVADQPKELGSILMYPPGWLERESVWLHMEYKYLLEVLRSGLVEEFFEDFRRAAIAFQPPQRYGRSVLENVSLVVSSVHPEPGMHGQGFYARLSGATAELFDIWLHMNVGDRPFRLGADGELRLRLEPALPAWLFASGAGTADWVRRGRAQRTPLPPHHYAFVLLNHTLVIYVNPTGRATAGDRAAAIERIELAGDDGAVRTVGPDELVGDLARRIRRGEFLTLTAHFA